MWLSEREETGSNRIFSGCATRESGSAPMVAMALMILAAGALSACGFQVRGTRNFPPSITAVYVDATNRHSPFYNALTTRIRSSDLELTRYSTDADTIIRVLNDETGQRPLTVSARNVPREYEVFYIVDYEVSINGAEASAPQQLILTRNYTWDETKVLGKAREEEVLRQAIASDLVGLLVQQVSAIN
jgi:LPS-assembly lipoprotein